MAIKDPFGYFVAICFSPMVTAVYPFLSVWQFVSLSESVLDNINSTFTISHITLTLKVIIT